MFEALKNLFRKRETMKGFTRIKSPCYKCRVRYERERCTMCYTCVKYCPASAIKVKRDGYVEIDPEKCIRCGVCVALCPTKALRMEK